MNKRFYIILSALAGMILLFSGCTKVEENIVNIWNLEPLQVDPEYHTAWDFQEDGTLLRIMEYGQFIDTCQYEIQEKLTYTAIKVVGSVDYQHLHTGVGHINGFWRVEEITDKKLIMTRYEYEDESTNGAYMRKEFLKAE